MRVAARRRAFENRAAEGLARVDQVGEPHPRYESTETFAKRYKLSLGL